jgi:hypothetical protein
MVVIVLPLDCMIIDDTLSSLGHPDAKPYKIDRTLETEGVCLVHQQQEWSFPLFLHHQWSFSMLSGTLTSTTTSTTTSPTVVALSYTSPRWRLVAASTMGLLLTVMSLLLTATL